jgi:hypothetical protein
MPERWHSPPVLPNAARNTSANVGVHLALIVKHPNMIKILSIIAVLGLTGCATAQNTYLKDGKQALSIDCSGEAMSWAACYEKADASCAGTGYNIVSTNGTPQPKEADKTLGVDVGNYKTRSVLVTCK